MPLLHHELPAALKEPALEAFKALRGRAAAAATEAFYTSGGNAYILLGNQGRANCQSDIEAHLDFLLPSLETGFLRPYSDYLRWFTAVRLARRMGVEQLGAILYWLGDFMAREIPAGGRDIARMISLGYEQSLQVHTPAPDDSQVLPQMPAFQQALLKGDRRAASAIIDALLEAGESVPAIYDHLIRPSLISVGIKWQMNEATVAEEHLATTTALQVIGDSFYTRTAKPHIGRSIVLACVEGNQHELGLRLVANTLEAQGWQVYYLGANTPSQDLLEFVRKVRPDTLGLSVSLPIHLAPARDVFQAIRAALKADVPQLVIGGCAIKLYPEFMNYTGADKCVSSTQDLSALA